jgi:predicted P-loop ATPase
MVGSGIRLQELARDRDQLWAEADALFHAGTRWWPETDAERALCNQEQDERVLFDVWAGVISEWLSGRKPGSRVSIREILTDCLHIELQKQDRAAQSRAGTCLSLTDWIPAGRVSGGKRERLYGRRDEVEPELRRDAVAAAEDVEREAIVEESQAAPEAGG